MGITEVCERAVVHAFSQQGTSHAASARAGLGEARQHAMWLLSSDKPVLVGDIWPVPLPEEATAFAPRPGIEVIERRVRELLRQAQAIPREDDDAVFEEHPESCSEDAPVQEQDAASSEQAEQSRVPLSRIV